MSCLLLCLFLITASATGTLILDDHALASLMRSYLQVEGLWLLGEKQADGKCEQYDLAGQGLQIQTMLLTRVEVDDLAVDFQGDEQVQLMVHSSQFVSQIEYAFDGGASDSIQLEMNDLQLGLVLNCTDQTLSINSLQYSAMRYSFQCKENAAEVEQWIYQSLLQRVKVQLERSIQSTLAWESSFMNTPYAFTRMRIQGHTLILYDEQQSDALLTDALLKYTHPLLFIPTHSILPPSFEFNLDLKEVNHETVISTRSFTSIFTDIDPRHRYLIVLHGANSAPIQYHPFQDRVHTTIPLNVVIFLRDQEDQFKYSELDGILEFDAIYVQQSKGISSYIDQVKFKITDESVQGIDVGVLKSFLPLGLKYMQSWKNRDLLKKCHELTDPRLEPLQIAKFHFNDDGLVVELEFKH